MTTVSTGILMPKLSYKFKTIFSVTAIPQELEQVESTLSVLSAQTVAVQTPTRVIRDPYVGTGKKRKLFNGIHFEGNLTLTIEDDAANKVASAVDLLVKLRSAFGNEGINVMIVNLDHNEDALEAFLYTDVKFVSEERSPFDYRAMTQAVSMRSSGSDEQPNVNVQVTFPERSGTQLRKIILKPSFAQYYRAVGTPATIDNLLGDI